MDEYPLSEKLKLPMNNEKIHTTQVKFRKKVKTIYG